MVLQLNNVYQLTMGTIDYDPEVVQFNKTTDEIETGPMGDCVSIIIFYEDNGMQYAIGRHGLGGIHAINATAMAQLVPVGATATAYIIPGPIVGDGITATTYRDEAISQMRAVFSQHQNQPIAQSTIVLVEACGNAKFDANGNRVD